MKVRNLLISQPTPVDITKSPYYEIQKKHNVSIDFYKFFKVEGVAGRDFRKEKINILDHSAIVFTSKNGVDHFFRLCQEMRIDPPEELKYFNISESISFYLQKYVQYRKRKIFHGRESIANLVEIITKHTEEKFLLPCSELHNNSLSSALDDLNVKYTKALMYKTMSNDLKHIDLNSYDMLVLFSPSGVKSIFESYPKFKQGNTMLAAFGDNTAQAIIDAGLKLTLSAPTETAASMPAAIDEFLSKNNKNGKNNSNVMATVNSK